MTKPFLTMTVLLLGITVHSFAKPSIFKKSKTKKGSTTQSSANKTTGIESRLLGSATWNHDGSSLTPSDSFRVSYTGDNGWDFNLDDWKYTTGKGWDHNGSAYEEMYRGTRSFDGSNRVVSSMFEVFTGSNWEIEEKDRYEFNTAGLVSVNVYSDYDGMDWDSTKYSYTYNGQGQVTEQLMADWDDMSSTWENSNRFINIYNGNGLVETELILGWNSTTSQWDSSNKRVNTYQNNKLTSTLSQQYMGGAWINSYLSTNTYDGLGNLTQTEGKNWSGGNWIGSWRETNTYNSSNDKTVSKSEVFNNGAYENSNEMSYTYNSHHQPLTETRKSWDASAGQFVFETGDNVTYNYYEEFTNSIEKKELAKGSMNIFPVPAQGSLTISVNWSNAQSASLDIYDMNGRVVKHSNLPAVAQSKTVVDVSSLPSGSYTVKITGTDSRLTQRISIVK